MQIQGVQSKCEKESISTVPWPGPLKYFSRSFSPKVSCRSTNNRPIQRPSTHGKIFIDLTFMQENECCWANASVLLVNEETVGTKSLIA